MKILIDYPSDIPKAFLVVGFNSMKNAAAFQVWVRENKDQITGIEQTLAIRNNNIDSLFVQVPR
jgi:hypothetical protein